MSNRRSDNHSLDLAAIHEVQGTANLYEWRRLLVVLGALLLGLWLGLAEGSAQERPPRGVDDPISEAGTMLDAFNAGIARRKEAAGHTVTVPFQAKQVAGISLVATYNNVTPGEPPTYSIRISLKVPQHKIQTLRWPVHAIADIHALMTLMESGRVSGWVVQAQTATATGLEACTECQIHEWLFTLNGR